LLLSTTTRFGRDDDIKFDEHEGDDYDSDCDTGHKHRIPDVTKVSDRFVSRLYTGPATRVERDLAKDELLYADLIADCGMLLY
jgi:hypothetical protein